MTPAEALKEIRGYAGVGRVVFTRHARIEMGNGGMSVQDVLHALSNAANCDTSTDRADRWRVTGPDLDGDDLTAVVVIESGLLVVTVF